MVSPGFVPADFAGDAYAFAQLDEDGNGGNPPVLIAGGVFLRAGGEPARRLSRWNGNSWSEFGGGANGPVNALFVWDSDGTGPLPAQLHVGGEFSEIGGQPIARIARWDGSQWQPLGAGIAGFTVYTIEGFTETIGGVSRLRLFAGGLFESAGGVAGTRDIARWDGVAWSAVGSPGSVQFIEKLVVFNPGGVGAQTRLYASEQGGVGIRAWNGSTWTGVYSGGGLIDDLIVHDRDGSGPLNPRLVAAGSILIPGGGSARHQAIEWNGQAWSSLGPTQTGSIYRIRSFDPDGTGPANPMLIACGNVAVATGEIVRLAGWDGTTWTQFADVDDAVSGLGVYDPDGSGPIRGKLFVNGYFAHLNGVTMPRLAAWDGLEWTAIGGANLGNGLSRAAQRIVAFDVDGDGPGQPAPYVGGLFSVVGDQSSLLYRVEADQWTEAAPSPGAFHAQVLHDPDGNGPAAPYLSVQGRVSGEEVLQYLDANGWHSLPWPFTSIPLRGISYDEFRDDEIPPLLVFGGSQFQVEPSLPGLAAWDGNAWSRLGGVVNNVVLAMTVFEPPDSSSPAQLIIGGSLSTAGGTPVRNVAMWDGASWQAMGAGVNFPARALCPFDPDEDGPLPNEVIVGGQFSMAGGQPASGIARWDGAAWHSFGSGVPGIVWALTTWDMDGAGGEPPVLVAAGSFQQVDGVAAANIAYWDGENWWPLGQGANSSVTELAVGNEHGPLGPQTLYASGEFTTMDGVLSERFARIVCAPPPCTGDVNGDRVIDLSDLATLLANFGTQSGGTLGGGDMNGDGAVDIQDLAMLLAAYGTTCG